MSIPPPPPIAAGTYKKGDIIGLGKTANWYYPYCVITVETFVCISTTYSGVVYISPPSEVYAEFFYPEWQATLDYAYPNTLTWVPWKVRYKGLYYRPSCWLTSTHVGIPPPTAVAGLGARLNKEWQFYKDDVKKEDVCTNQSHPTRAWLLLGSLEEDNGWNNPYSSIEDPISGEKRRIYLPVSFVESVDDLTKIGGDYGGYYQELYYPQLSHPVKWVNDPDRAALYQATPQAQRLYEPSTFLKPFNQKGMNYYENDEPYSWDFYSGKMATINMLSTSAYYLMGAGYGGYDSYYYNYGSQGMSINLWQQQIARHTSRKKYSAPYEDGKGGTYVHYKIQYSDRDLGTGPMPENKTMMLCVNPGPGFQEYYYNFYLYSHQVARVPNGAFEPTANGHSQKYNLFFQSTHPVMFTREITWQERTYTDTYEQAKFYMGDDSFGNPIYSWRQTNESHVFVYTAKSFTSSYNQLTYFVYSTDGNGGHYYDVPANQVGTFTESYNYSSDGHSFVQVHKDLHSGVRFTPD